MPPLAATGPALILHERNIISRPGRRASTGKRLTRQVLTGGLGSCSNARVILGGLKMNKKRHTIMLMAALSIIFLLAAAITLQAEPVAPDAACKMRPECSTNADCDSQCGVGLGHCVHSSCPVRVCHCN